MKGVYHINAVDEVTQWQVVGATAQISEAWLMPVLKAMLRQFPFRIVHFHSDNGGESINHTVEKLLNKLLIEQSKSRPRRSTDNGLVEAKNGAVIRKHMGYGHIASAHAEAINAFYESYFNPYLNFHRPCGVPEIRTDKKGKRRGDSHIPTARRSAERYSSNQRGAPVEGRFAPAAQAHSSIRICFIGFSCRMSLNEGSRMLGLDRQDAGSRTVEPGADPGVFGGQR